MTISLRPATPATVEKILDALRAELRPLVDAGRPFQVELHGGPDRHVRLVVTSFLDVDPTEPLEPLEPLEPRNSLHERRRR